MVTQCDAQVLLLALHSKNTPGGAWKPIWLPEAKLGPDTLYPLYYLSDHHNNFSISLGLEN